MAMNHFRGTKAAIERRHGNSFYSMVDEYCYYSSIRIHLASKKYLDKIRILWVALDKYRFFNPKSKYSRGFYAL